MNRATRTRTATALTLVAGVLTVLFVLPPPWAFSVLGAVAVLGLLEWADLAGVARLPARLAYALALVGVLHLARQFAPPALLWVVLGTAALWWLLAAAWVTAYQLRGTPGLSRPGWLLCLGIPVFLPALWALGELLERGPLQVLALFGLVWSADICAYFGGRRWGRRRLVSRVSPGKTWAGLWSGLAGTLALVLAVGTATSHHAWPGLAILGLATFVAAVYGDLFESLLKRLRGRKDSGTLLPGHGGVLDRIDSLLAAAPIFLLVLLILDPR